MNRYLVLAMVLTYFVLNPVWSQDQKPPAEKLSKEKQKKIVQLVETIENHRTTYRTRRKATKDLVKMGGDAVPTLIRLYETTKKHYVKSEAFWALAKIGHPAALPIILQNLGRKTVGTRNTVNNFLLRLGAKSVPSLVKSLDHRTPYVRHRALEVLGKIGTNASSAVGAVEKCLQDDPYRNVRKEAGQTLFFLGKTAPDQAKPTSRQIQKWARQLVRDMSNSNLKYSRRVEGLNELIQLGPATVPALTKALAHKNLLTRKFAARALRKFGPAAAPAVPRLTRLLGDGNYTMRTDAARALGSIGAKAVSAAPQLLEMLVRGKTREDRNAAALALGKIGLGPDKDKTLPLLLKGLKEQSWSIRRRTLRALAKMDPNYDGKIIPAVTPLLKDKHHPVRLEAAKTLGKLGPRGASATSNLIEALTDENSNVSKRAAWALGKIGRPAIPFLVKALAHKNSHLRYEVTKLLADLGSVPTYGLPPLVKLLKSDPNHTIRREAARAIGTMGAAAKPAVPVLVKALSDKHGDVRDQAAKSLIQLGPQAKSAVPALFPLIAGKSNNQREAARKILYEIGLYSVPTLLKNLNHNHPDVQLTAIRLVGRAGPAGAQAVPTLIQKLSHKRLSIRQGAAKTLGQIGPKAATAIPHLVKKLDGKDYRVRRRAIRAIYLIGPKKAAKFVPQFTRELKFTNNRIDIIKILGKIGSPAAPATPILVDFLSDRNRNVRKYAAEALDKINPSPKVLIPLLLKERTRHSRYRRIELEGKLKQLDSTAVPFLTKALSHKDPKIRLESAHILAQLAPKTPNLTATLIKALGHKNYRVRQRVCQTLGTLPSPPPTVITALAVALEDKNHYVIRQAAHSLGNLGPSATPAVPNLIKAHKKNRSLLNTPRILANIGPKVLPYLIKLFEKKDRTSPLLAANTIYYMGEKAASAIPHLVKALESKNSYIQRRAAYALGKIGPKALPHVAPLLDRKDQKLVSYVVDALGVMGPVADSTVPRLAALLEKKDVHLQKSVIRALGFIGTRPRLVVPKLTQLISNKQLSVIAIHSLSRYRSHAAPAVPRLIKKIRSQDRYIQRESIIALGEIGPAAVAAAPALFKYLQNRPRYLRLAAVALGKVSFNSKTAVGPVAKALVKYKGTIQYEIPYIKALGEIGPPAASVVPYLARRLTRLSYSYRTQSAILKTLSKIGPQGAAALPQVISLVRRRPRFEVLFAALQYFTTLGPQAAPAVPHLIKFLKHRSSKARRVTVEALAEIGPPAAPAVPHLIPLLNDWNDTTRTETAYALGKIGRKTPAVIAGLIKAVDDRNLSTRLEAAAALADLGAKSRAVPAKLVEMVKSQNPREQIVAAYCLIKLKGTSPPHLAILTKYLNLKGKNFDLHCAYSLTRLGRERHRAHSIFRKATKSRNVNRRWLAYRYLGHTGPNGGIYLALLQQGLQDPHPSVRWAAMKALFKLRREGVKAQKLPKGGWWW